MPPFVTLRVYITDVLGRSFEEHQLYTELDIDGDALNSFETVTRFVSVCRHVTGRVARERPFRKVHLLNEHAIGGKTQ